MPKQYLIDLESNDNLDAIIKKANHNFKALSVNANRRSQLQQAETENSIEGAFSTLSDEISNVIDNMRYENLPDKPSIESVTLIGDKTFPELNIFIDPEDDPVTEHPSSDDYALTSSEITALWNAAS